MCKTIKRIILLLPVLFYLQPIICQTQFEYLLYYKSKTFEEPIVYSEKCLIENDKKYSIAELRDFDAGVESEKNISPNETTNEYLPKILYRVYHDLKTKESLTHEMVLLKSKNPDDLFEIIGTLENIQWEITNEKKTIDKFNCIKATTSFRCKKYIAWFTPEIPLSSGPWKLSGLPGLIVEAYDENKIRYYVLTKYSPSVTASQVKELVTNGETIKTYSVSQLKAYYEKMKRNLIARSSISDVNLDCVDCPNTKKEISLNLWECY